VVDKDRIVLKTTTDTFTLASIQVFVVGGLLLTYVVYKRFWEQKHFQSRKQGGGIFSRELYLTDVRSVEAQSL